MKRIASAFPLLALLVGLLSGCATLAPRSVVSVTVVDVRPLRPSLLETGAVLTLRFTNESPEPLQLKGSSHRLSLNGSSVGRAVSNTPLTLPALGTLTHEVTFALDNLALVRKAREFSKAPAAIDYRLESQLFTVDGPTSGHLRAVSTGQLDVRGLIDATGGAMPVKSD